MLINETLNLYEMFSGLEILRARAILMLAPSCTMISLSLIFLEAAARINLADFGIHDRALVLTLDLAVVLILAVILVLALV